MAHLMMVVSEKKRALDRLLKSATIKIYFKKYKYAEHCMAAVKRESLDLGEMPEVVAQKIERELDPAWERV